VPVTLSDNLNLSLVARNKKKPVSVCVADPADLHACVSIHDSYILPLLSTDCSIS